MKEYKETPTNRELLRQRQAELQNQAELQEKLAEEEAALKKLTEPVPAPVVPPEPIKPAVPPKTHKEARIEMLDRQDNPNNPDFVTPKIEPKPEPSVPAPITQAPKQDTQPPAQEKINPIKPEANVGLDAKATKVEAIARLRKIIENIDKRFEKSRIQREKDKVLIKNIRKELEEIKAKKQAPSKSELKAKLADLESELEKTPETMWQKHGELEYEISKLEEQIREKEKEELLAQEKAEKKEALEKDREKNPFKHFLISKMSDEAFGLVFGKGETRDEISLETLNRQMGDETGKEVGFHSFNYIVPENFNTLHFSTNGFSLQLQNPNEVWIEENGKQVLGIYEPNAKYKLFDPNGKHPLGEDALSYEEGSSLLEERARQYQEKQLEEFELKNQK